MLLSKIDHFVISIGLNKPSIELNLSQLFEKIIQKKKKKENNYEPQPHR